MPSLDLLHRDPLWRAGGCFDLECLLARHIAVYPALSPGGNWGSDPPQSGVAGAGSCWVAGFDGS